LHCRMKSEIWICELALWSVAGFRFRWWCFYWEDFEFSMSLGAI
jgi:hypothetical protein